MIPDDRLHGFVAAGVLRFRSRQPDMTGLTDDAACKRLVLHCTLCGAPAADMELRVWWTDIHVVAVAVCPSCQR
jgi:hypothetical protein